MSSVNHPVPLKPGEGAIRCPAIRSLIKENKLSHDELKTASVQDLVRVFSGQPRRLSPNEAGSLANVTGFFAIHNHGVPVKDDRGFFSRLFGKSRDILDAAAVAAGRPTSRRFRLALLGSGGDHPGSVDFFSNDQAGEFQPGKFASVMSQISDGKTLTIDGIARMIITANSGDPKAGPVDLGKSAGEWALMVCVLRASPHTTDISVADLEKMYSQADSTKLLAGTMQATALEWVKVTAQITAAIATQKGEAVADVARHLHSAYGDINEEHDEKLCPCMTCNPAVW